MRRVASWKLHLSMAPRRVSAENLEVVEPIFEAIGFKRFPRMGCWELTRYEAINLGKGISRKLTHGVVEILGQASRELLNTMSYCE